METRSLYGQEQRKIGKKAIAIIGALAIIAVVAYVATSEKVIAGQRLLASDEPKIFSEEEKAFFHFIQEHRRMYFSKEEYTFRLAIFGENYRLISEHNADPSYTYKLAVNQFADMTPEEFEYHYVSKGTPKRTGAPMQVRGVDPLPLSWDWRNHGAVTSVKNQGSCGSCWSFSAVAALEGSNAINRGELLDFSEQELVDCATAPTYDNYGCDGGWMDEAFQYVHDHGLHLDSQYPYVGVDQACGVTGTPYVWSSGYVDVPESNGLALKEALYNQPVSVAIQANQLRFQFYSSGVINKGCGTNLDHGVTLVGYGRDAPTNQDYWIIKNSWGAGWGEQGYVRTLRSDSTNDPQVCGVALAASYPNAINYAPTN